MKKAIDGEALKELLMDNHMSVPEFAVNEAKLHPQTVYKAMSGEPVGRRSFGNLVRAIDRLKQHKVRAVS